MCFQYSLNDGKESKEICGRLEEKRVTPMFNAAIRATIIAAILFSALSIYIIIQHGSKRKIVRKSGILVLLAGISGLTAAIAYTIGIEIDRKKLPYSELIKNFGVTELVEMEYSWGYVLIWVGVAFALAAFSVTLTVKREIETVINGDYYPSDNIDEIQLIVQ